MVGVLEQNDCILEKYETEIQLVNKKDDVEVANKSNEVQQMQILAARAPSQKHNHLIYIHFLERTVT